MPQEHNQDSQNEIAKHEEEILRLWQENQIFEKTLQRPSAKGNFIFYDGPPFANGLPHYGHILASIIKDAIPRYKTMRGFCVPRRWGWDCHGLPVENLVEKELSLRSKKDIETYGLERFNEAAKGSVMRFADEWRKQISRIGRFVDMERDYRTMDSSFTESVWWAFKTLHDQGRVYKGFKSMHLCPRCETTLSNFEVSQGYKESTDISVYAKFPLTNEPGTFFLVWTTTPWTLPGNVALAVNPDLQYVRVKVGSNNYILAESRLAVLQEAYQVIEKFLGRKLVGESYKPLFDYYIGAKLPNIENAFRAFGAKFVTAEDGTGIVHIAPAFGEDDYQLSQEKKLPFIQHVLPNGVFTPEVKDFAGLQVKPKGNPKETDQKILENLANRALVYRAEEINHPYPHCWRCDTPLLNYTASSWFVKVTAIKEKLVAENKKIKWVPGAVGQYRFGNWLAEARDWAISRSRFWGAPLPVWRCEKCEREEVIGSVDDLKRRLPTRNRYFLMRHGEAENNTKKILVLDPNAPSHLTELGKKQVKTAGEDLRRKKIDLIFASPFVRTLETAEIVRVALGLPKEAVIVDERLREITSSEFNGRSVSDYQRAFSSFSERFTRKLGGENYEEIKNRVGLFLYDTDSKYQGKNILVVTHDAPAWLLAAAAGGLTPSEALRAYPSDFNKHDYIRNGEVKSVDFRPLPHNKNFELDLHRPHIDRLVLDCDCGGQMKRTPEVFDCWFESGSMPFASCHYPFENLEEFNPKPGIFRSPKGFPADFIAEGLDQTRGWFYSMLVLGVALFGRSPYKAVVVNGTVLSENGQKMSKRLQNYPDPMAVVSKYGADALRFYLFSSPAVRGEELRFSERGVLEVKRKVFDRLENILAFYLLYADKKQIPNSKHQIPNNFKSPNSQNVLDVWVMIRLYQLIKEVTASLEVYELDKATRPIADFVDDLSTWYLRRSRSRFKFQNPNPKSQTNSKIQTEKEIDKQMALATTRYVLLELAKVLAPFTPFFAEHLYQSIHNANIANGGNANAANKKESVHLEEWPATSNPRPTTLPHRQAGHDQQLIQEMKEVRKIVSLALEARAKANIKVRQPLASLKIPNSKFQIPNEMIQLIKDEVNVKEIVFDPAIQNEVELDTAMTPELKEEGMFRELVRYVQDMRKRQGFKPGESGALLVGAVGPSRRFIEQCEQELAHAASLRNITVQDAVEDAELFQADELSLQLFLTRSS